MKTVPLVFDLTPVAMGERNSARGECARGLFLTELQASSGHVSSDAMNCSLQGTYLVHKVDTLNRSDNSPLVGCSRHLHHTPCFFL